MTKWIASLAAACCLVLISLPGMTTEMASLDQRIASISVAVGKSYAPFYFTDQKGKPAGWLVDIWRLWSRKTGVRVNFVAAPFADTLKLVAIGKVDVHGGCFYSKERARNLEFVGSLVRTTASYFFDQGIYGIDVPQDLMAFRVGVIKGDYSEGYLRQKLPGISLAEYATNEKLFQAVKNGLIRVFVADTPVGVYWLQKYGLTAQFKYYPERPLYSKLYRPALKKGNKALAPVIKKGLEQITAEEKEEIARRWLESAHAKAEGVLKIACDRNYPPFTWRTPSGRPAGMLIDLWRLWAAKTGTRIEFIFGDWSETLKYLRNGQADIHSGLFESPRNAQWLSFSLPLFPVDVNLFYPVKKGPPALNDMKGKKIGILRGTSFGAWLPEEFPGCRLVIFDNFDEMLPALAQNKLDAVVDVGLSIEFALKNMGLAGSVERYQRALRTQKKTRRGSKKPIGSFKKDK